MQARVQYRAPAHALVSVCTSFLRCRKGRGGMGLDTRCTGCWCACNGMQVCPHTPPTRPTCYVEMSFYQHMHVVHLKTQSRRRHVLSVK